MEAKVQLDLAEDRGEKKLKDIKRYQAIVSLLMYAALATWLNISFAAAELLLDCSCHVTSYLSVAKRVLQYLKSTTEFQLHFSCSTCHNDRLTSYTDSDGASDSADRKSHGRHSLLLSNGADSRQSYTQDPINISTLEAKNITCSEGSCEANWLLLLHRDVRHKCNTGGIDSMIHSTRSVPSK